MFDPHQDLSGLVESARVHEHRSNRAEVDQHHDGSEEFLLTHSAPAARTASRTLHRLDEEEPPGPRPASRSIDSRRKTPQSDSLARSTAIT